MVRANSASCGSSEARFRAVFDTVLEVLVLMEPDGTVSGASIARKRRGGQRTRESGSEGRKIWDAPTLMIYREHVDLMKRAVKQAAAGKLFEEEVRIERDGAPTGLLNVSVQPVRDAHGKVVYLLFEARDITDFEARAGGTAPEPEDGGARPAHRRHRARLQQSADRHGRWAGHDRDARRGGKGRALGGERPRRNRARGALTAQLLTFASSGEVRPPKVVPLIQKI